MSTCQTCHSQLSPPVLKDTHITPCCSTPICGPCLSRNPRLRYYDPCLRCGDVRTESGEAKIREGKQRALADTAAREQGQFAIGDDDDDDDRPPSYRETPNSDSHNDEDAGPSSRRYTPDAPAVEEGKGDTEIVEIKHPVFGSDTLWTIARRYGADPYDLLTLNLLPPTALTSNPRIIQTRKTLIISRRRLPRGSLPDSLVFDAGEALDPEEEKRREAEKRIKRFQLITKTTDAGVGKAYLGLAEMDAERDVLDEGSGEALPTLEEIRGEVSGGKKKVKAAGKEDRALDAFWEDSAWEAEVGGPERVKVNGRWTVVGSGRPLAGLSIKS